MFDVDSQGSDHVREKRGAVRLAVKVRVSF